MKFCQILFCILFISLHNVDGQSILPQQNNLVLEGRSVIVIRGVDPATHSWQNTDDDLEALQSELDAYIRKVSFNKTWVDSFDITPVFDFTVDPNNNGFGAMSQKLRALANADGFIVDNYNVVLYLHESSTDFGGAGALGSGNGLNGTVWANNNLTWYHPGNIHETFHAFGVGHAEGIEGGNEIYPPIQPTGGADPYHFMGSQGDADLDTDVPNYMKYFLGWIDQENVIHIPSIDADCQTHRIYKSSLVNEYNENHNYAIQLSNNLWISYEPDNSNSRIESKGLLFHYIPFNGSAVTRIIDTHPNSITDLPSDLGDNWLGVIDFWDAAMESGETLNWEGNAVEIESIGGSGDEKWVDIKLCNCITLSGDDDGDGVCNEIDVCEDGDDTVDADFDGIPDDCDSCPLDPDNDANMNGICDDLECLSLTVDQFDYASTDLIEGLNGGSGFANAWGQTPMNGSIEIVEGSLEFPNSKSIGNKLRISLKDEDESKGCTRTLDKPYSVGKELWISALIHSVHLADGGFWIKPNGIQSIAIGKRWGNNLGIDNNGTDIFINEGETYRLVARYQIQPGQTVVHLWINRYDDFTENNANATKTINGASASIQYLDISMERYGDGIFELDELSFGCDGLPLIIDNDGDGFYTDEDCNDGDISINPGMEEIPNNGIDEDCDGTDLITQTVDIHDSSISVYPNPTSNNLYIKVDLDIDYHARILDLNGRLISKTSNPTMLDLSNLIEGNYIIEIVNGKKNVLFRESIILIK